MRWVGLLLLTACGDSTGTTDGNPPTVVGYADADLDGYIASVDCDDENPAVNPGQPEVCNTIDDDCDGGIDNNAVDGSVGFVDADGDMVGSDVPLVSCTVPGWSPDSGDCDDADAARFPGNTEVCNGVDDDCDLGVDEGATIGNVRYDHLGDAVLAAAEGDVLTLCDGTVRDGAILVARTLTITSVSGDPALTVIDGSGVGSSVFIVDGGDLTLDGVTVTGGSGTLAPLLLGEPPALAGGAINALTGDGGPVTVRNAVFDGNSARAGGAIAAQQLTIEDCTFTGNSASGISPGEGGAVWVSAEGNLTVERTLFEGNLATEGGAIEARSPVTLGDVEATGNVASSGAFARIQSEDGLTPASLAIVGGNLHDNIASVQGGALFLMHANGTADAATTFTGNVAAEGGALVVTTGIVGGPVVTWSGGTFMDNSADTVGGAILVEANDAPVEIADVVVTDNTSDAQGGGLMLRGTNAGACTVRDSLVSGNLADSGGGLTLSNIPAVIPPMVLERVEIRDNVALLVGGGLYQIYAEVELTDVVIADNVADSGGGVWMDSLGKLDITSSDFPGNLPQDVWFGAAVLGTDLPDADATLVCVGADATCL